MYKRNKNERKLVQQSMFIIVTFSVYHDEFVGLIKVRKGTHNKIKNNEIIILIESCCYNKSHLKY